MMKFSFHSKNLEFGILHALDSQQELLYNLAFGYGGHQELEGVEFEAQ